jgi:hypothetical protein
MKARIFDFLPAWRKGSSIFACAFVLAAPVLLPALGLVRD